MVELSEGINGVGKDVIERLIENCGRQCHGFFAQPCPHHDERHRPVADRCSFEVPYSV